MSREIVKALLEQADNPFAELDERSETLLRTAATRITELEADKAEAVEWLGALVRDWPGRNTALISNARDALSRLSEGSGQ